MAKYAQILVHTLPYNKENVGFGSRSAMLQENNEKDDVFLILTGLGARRMGLAISMVISAILCRRIMVFPLLSCKRRKTYGNGKTLFLKKSRQITYKPGGGYILWACRQGRALHYGMRPAIRKSGAFCV